MHTDRGRRLETNGEKDDRAASLYKVSVVVLGWGPPGGCGGTPEQSSPTEETAERDGAIQW